LDAAEAFQAIPLTAGRPVLATRMRSSQAGRSRILLPRLREGLIVVLVLRAMAWFSGCMGCIIWWCSCDDDSTDDPKQRVSFWRCFWVLRWMISIWRGV